MGDDLFGNDGHDVLYGDNVDDSGVGNPDFLVGGSGNDIAHGGGGNDSFDWYLAPQPCGCQGDDRFYGDAGHDKFADLAGVDHFYGGTGDDFVSMFSRGPLVVDLRDDIARTSDGRERVVQIEAIQGSDRADVLIGDADNNTLFGRGGADRLVGNGAGDVLAGGPRDVLLGGSGADYLIAPSDARQLSGGSGADTVEIAKGRDAVAPRPISGGRGLTSSRTRTRSSERRRTPCP